MAEYIEREKLIAELNNIALDLLKDNSIQCSLAAGTVVDIKDNVVAKQPTIDAVEVVRCGQCKNWKINPNNLYGGQCRFSECASIDHFCSRGERKERKDGAKNG